MQLHDTANTEWHEGTVSRSYYRGSRIALVVYSCEEMDSVDDLTMYIQDVKYHAPNAKLFLIRSKIDLEDQTVQEDEVDAKLRKAGYSFDEPKCKHSVSSKNGEGVENLLKAVGQVLIKQQHTRQDSTKHHLSSYHVERPNVDSGSKCC